MKFKFRDLSGNLYFKYNNKFLKYIIKMKFDSTNFDIDSGFVDEIYYNVLERVN
ncbi:hypothetical protein [Clostridioides difficile]|uniref:hypothetical protein n=1 Tax=Clostridioides difficile TaxID=1496 RepID=UPI00130490C6|nr:hypothetical protein [Clostridioides difficile]HBG7286371.1 hypothetical protein [Clostridioides difficile]